MVCPLAVTWTPRRASASIPVAVYLPVSYVYHGEVLVSAGKELMSQFSCQTEVLVFLTLLLYSGPQCIGYCPLMLGKVL